MSYYHPVPLLIAWMYERGLVGDGTEWSHIDLQSNLEVTVGQMMRLGADREVTAAWLHAMVAAPNRFTSEEVMRLIFGWKVAEALPWLALAATGPLAYAVGLTVEEAEVGLAAGTQDVEGLRVLAGLRGWVFPPEIGFTSIPAAVS